MDWFSWLSKSSLEPKLVYQYGLAFAQNQLQEEDLSYFNHEFLQSMGISVAKHRLEILKLVKEKRSTGPNNIFKLMCAINKTRIGIRNCMKKLFFHDNFAVKALPQQSPVQRPWRGAFTRRYKSEKEPKVESPPAPPTPPILNKARRAKSGPLDGRSEVKSMLANRSLKLSGPLDGKDQQEMWVVAYRSPRFSKTPDGGMQQKFIVPARSPTLPRYSERRHPSPKINREYKKDGAGNGGFHDNSAWAALFQDMKPT